MSLQVKIVLAAINTACLLVTLLCPATVTPLVLLTTIASAVTWAFSQQEQSSLNRKWQLHNTYIAAFLAIVCIVLGVTATISQPDTPAYAGQFVFTFDSSVVLLGGRSFDYIFFAIMMFFWIVSLMRNELEYTNSFCVFDNPQPPQEPEPQPIAHYIKQQLAEIP